MRKPGQFEKGDPRIVPGRRKGSKNKLTRAAFEFAEGLLNDPDYQENLKARIERGKAGAVETYLWGRVVGLAKQQIEVTAGAPLFVMDKEPALTGEDEPKEKADEAEDANVLDRT